MFIACFPPARTVSPAFPLFLQCNSWLSLKTRTKVLSLGRPVPGLRTRNTATSGCFLTDRGQHNHPILIEYPVQSAEYRMSKKCPTLTVSSGISQQKKTTFRQSGTFLGHCMISSIYQWLFAEHLSRSTKSKFP